MKTLAPALEAHLASGATTMAYCWRVSRHDGVVLGFTEHDRDLVYAGQLYAAASGFTASQIAQGLGLSVDNMEAQGALSSDAITEADLLAGRYDDASVDLYWVNWADPTMGVTIASGNIGEVKRQGLAFTAEIRSIANRLNQKIGQSYERNCSAELGDSRCTVDLTSSLWSATVTATSSGLTAALGVDGLSGFAADFFSSGVLRFLSGLNEGLGFEVRAHARTAGADRLDLWLPTPFAVAAGDEARVTAGCRKTAAVCRSKFDNLVNFRGYPFIPGMDAVTRYATSTNATAGSPASFTGGKG